MITQTADEIRMKAARISWSSTYSSMTSDGKLTCTSGKIGGWTIGSNALYSGMTLTETLHNNGVVAWNQRHSLLEKADLK